MRVSTTGIPTEEIPSVEYEDIISELVNSGLGSAMMSYASDMASVCDAAFPVMLLSRNGGSEKVLGMVNTVVGAVFDFYFTNRYNLYIIYLTRQPEGERTSPAPT